MAIKIPLITEFNDKGIKSAIKQFKQLETAGEKASFAIKKAAVPAAAALGGLAVAGFKAAKAAMEDQKSSAELARQLRISTQATDAQVAATEDLIGKMTLATGVADTDLRNAMATLARGMGSAELAQKNLNLALDISAATGKDLTSVSEALSKAYNGQTTALAKLDPSMRGLVKEGASFNEIGAIMAETFGGAASEAANTAEGRFKRMGVAISEAQESIGMALLPVIEKLLPYLERAAHWVGENTDVAVKLGVAIGAVAAAVIGINTAMKVYTAVTTAATAAQAAFNAVAALNPFVLIATGVVAATAAIVTFRKEIRAAFDEFDRFTKKFGFLGRLGGAAVKAANPIAGVVKGIADIATGIFGKSANISLNGPSMSAPTLAAAPGAAPTVVVNAGVGDPVAIGREVMAVLRQYQTRTGSIPLRAA
jgi:hypothetical protein